VPGWRILTPDDLELAAPSGGDQTRGIMHLSDSLRHTRANIWRMAPGSRGRRHLEKVQEELFVVLAGTASLRLGDPGETVELPQGSVVIVEPETPLQLLNDGTEDALVLVVGAPPEPGHAEYLPD
jgi:mannose-6-phosphate isomerase-like protein (cupin superfamily)